MLPPHLSWGVVGEDRRESQRLPLCSDSPSLLQPRSHRASTWPQLYVPTGILSSLPEPQGSTYLSLCPLYPYSLTGISPFVGENDRTTLMNIRNYNVAFEETTFLSLSREARSFLITVLVQDQL